MNDTLPENVAAALDKDTFDVLSFVAGYGMPVDSVEVYTDASAARRLAELAALEKANADKAEVEGLGIADELEWVDPDELQELKDRIESSKLRFNIRGIAPKARDAIRKNLTAEHNYGENATPDQAEAFLRAFTLTLMYKSIESVTHVESGKTDTTPWTLERAEQLMDSLYESEFFRIDKAVYELSFNTDLFDRAAAADFLSKR